MKAGFESKLPAGSWIRLPDGRVATTVYHGPDGYGIKWGLHTNWEDFGPDAMLREPYDGRDLPCVGEDYELVESAQADAEKSRDENAEGWVDAARERDTARAALRRALMAARAAWGRAAIDCGDGSEGAVQAEAVFRAAERAAEPRP